MDTKKDKEMVWPQYASKCNGDCNKDYKIFVEKNYVLKREVPKGWRQGQTMFNFLEWLAITGRVSASKDAQIADAFNVSDEEWEQWYGEFLTQHTV